MTIVDLFAAIGTILNAATTFPHLARAIRTSGPVGSPLGWLASAAASSIWIAYGLVSGNVWTAVPNFVIVPVALTLMVVDYRRRHLAAPVDACEYGADHETPQPQVQTAA